MRTFQGSPPPFTHTRTPQRERVIVDLAEHYVEMAQELRAEELPAGTQWRGPEAYRDKLVASKEYQWVNYREQKYMLRLQSEADEMSKLVQ